MKYDFVAIGDTATDAFIRLEKASVYCDLSRERCQICMNFADKIPYESVTTVPAVGNSANAAVAAARLGLKSALVSNVGDDFWGEQCLKTFKKEKVETKYIKINKKEKTNYHFVLWYENERTILIKHQPFKYHLPAIGVPSWLYFSSIGEKGKGFHKIVESYLKKHPTVKLAFQPGTFQIKMGKKFLAGVYKKTEAFFCNKEEAERILEAPRSDIRQLLKGINKLGPKIVVITDGTKGAYAYSDGHEGEQMWSMRIYPDPKPPLERTGAGDAFSSTFTVALALGKSVPEALRWAPISPMSVVQQVGAQAGLPTRNELEGYLKKAPKDYVAKKFF